MIDKRKKIILLLLEVVEYLLSIIAAVVIAFILKLDRSSVKYIFLVLLFYVNYSIYKTLFNNEDTVVSKNKKVNINSKYINKLSI